MTVSFLDFLYIGREQRHVQRNPLARLFYTLFGLLSTHARVRVGHVLQAVDALPLPCDAQVLDAGSGYGYTVLALARRHPTWQVTGVEIDPVHVWDGRHIAQVEGLDGARLVQGNLVTHTEPPATYDLIVSGDVLEHIVEDEMVLGKLYTWLKPGGWLVLHLPKRHQLAQRWFPAFRRYLVHDHVRDEYTEDEIRTKLGRVGFLIQSLTYSFGPAGELAFELNQLAWDRPVLRSLVALLTFPLAVPLAYLDLRLPKSRGNAFVIVARKSEGVP